MLCFKDVILNVFCCAVSFKNLTLLCNLNPLLTLGCRYMNRVESILCFLTYDINIINQSIEDFV